MFRKKEQHLATYVATQGKSQIDLMLVRRKDKRSSRNCKVIPNEWEEGQHRLVVMDFVLRKEKVGRRRRKRMERVKWGKLKDREIELGLRLSQEVD